MKKVVIKQCITLNYCCPNCMITVISKMDLGEEKIGYCLLGLCTQMPSAS